jgi:hypothetical protein
MRIELWIILGGIFFIADTVNNHKYTKALVHYQKHAKVVAAIFTMFSVYKYTQNNPGESTQLMGHLNGIIKYMPLDQHSKDLISPIFHSYHENRLLNSGHVKPTEENAGSATVRSVSATKKKYVAAQQGWTCGGCKKQLDAWFEVDHKQRLADGGSNHISNLVALCRNCHGKKTMFENM